MNHIKILAYIIWLLFIIAYIYIIYSIWKDSKKK